MVAASVTIKNATGLHLRPAGVLCENAMKFPCKVMFKTDNDYEANAKSVLSVLGACVKSGQQIEIICDGENEEEALKYLTQIINDGLGE